MVKYELTLKYALETPKNATADAIARVLLCGIFCANHATSTALRV